MGNYASAAILNTGEYPYTSPISGITVSATWTCPTLGNYTYSCGGNSFATESPAWWINGAGQNVTLTFDAPVTNFSVVVNGTGPGETFYFAAGTGTITLNNYCTAGFNLVTSSSLNCTASSTGTLITVDNPTGSNTYVLTHNGAAAGSRYALLDCFTATAILPAEMGTFDALYLSTANRTDIEWETLSESNIDGFEVEHSLTGNRDTWETLGFVNGAGESHEALKYEFQHSDPGSGEHFYRIKQMDKDGRYAYSSVKTVNVVLPSTFTVFPNPSSGVIEVSAPNLAGKLEVMNMHGQIVESRPFTGTERLDLSNRAKGVYIFKVISNDHQSYVRKVIVK